MKIILCVFCFTSMIFLQGCIISVNPMLGGKAYRVEYSLQTSTESIRNFNPDRWTIGVKLIGR